MDVRCPLPCPLRFVFLDALRTRTPAVHSLILCMSFGPLGFLSHIATKAVLAQLAVLRRRRQGEEERGAGVDVARVRVSDL